jgi:hypothetical protein
MNEIIARWRLEMPQFFKNVSAIGKVVALFGAIIMTACVGAPELVSETVLHYAKLAASYMVFGGGIIAALSQLTVEDKEQLEKLKNEKTTGTDQ